MINLLTADYGAWVSTAFRTLGPVFRSSLPPLVHAGSIECASNDVILNAWQIFNAPPSNQHDRVLLKVMTLSGYICCYLAIIAQPHSADFSQCRVRLPRGDSTHLSADATFLWSAFEPQPPLLQSVIGILQVGRLRFLLDWHSPLAHKLTDRRQILLLDHELSAVPRLRELRSISISIYGDLVNSHSGGDYLNQVTVPVGGQIRSVRSGGRQRQILDRAIEAKQIFLTSEQRFALLRACQ